MTPRSTRTDRTTALSSDQRSDVRRLVEEATADDGFSALNEAAELALAEAGSEHAVDHLLAVDGDRLVGYGQLLDATGSLVVHPDHRRHGTGSALLAELITLGRARGAGPVAFWATRDTTAARALAERHGLTRQRELLIMKRPLTEPVAPAPIPTGIEIRAFQVGVDEAQWLTVNRRAFAHHPEQGAITRADLDQRIGQDWFDPAGFLVATDGDTMIGFHWTKQHPGTLGEVYVIGVDPDRSGGGIGSALLTRGLIHLAERGDDEVILYTEGENAGAIALYQRTGFTIDTRDVMYSTTAIHGG
ncbi:mycothiol synthase [Microlunatus speluncae]|uniref:mycothiol synthase n=1 Tax=Microlunatus speluncae TaxID=2594267 RepID=UPI001C2D875E|nr:mycothiol synthase [Microlunatus speluncae]